MCKDLHHKQRKYLVLLLDLAGTDGVTVVVVGEHHEATVGTDEEETPDAKHVPPDGSETLLVLSKLLDKMAQLLGRL